MRLNPGPDAPRSERTGFEALQNIWLTLAKRVGIEAEPVLAQKDLDWGRVERTPLGDFDATDLTGRRWTIHDWKGRVVLVNIWATWCPPCRAELPYLQKLHDEYQGRGDRLIISINIDSDEQLVQRLLLEQGYTFPVLRSRQLADRIDFLNGVPQNRLIDTEGRLLVEPVEGTGDSWVAKVKSLMDQIK